MKSDQEDSDHSREETQIQDENVSIYMYSSSIVDKMLVALCSTREREGETEGEEGERNKLWGALHRT